ncbi:hypothetical protein GK047_24575 [Paenibacillus sp. SYP-B3998]|uniref:Hint domain-containing protein n=1 Tax=Paenibacillus sp. SYP-B3998 TaxID=2678564 RepID=A0A6G4A5D1_9BACL|nr:hypothetical protein [Paenibacillus sp. SYP-B3998]
MLYGEKSIEDVQVGDKVLSKNTDTGEQAYKEVEQLFQKEVSETYTNEKKPADLTKTLQRNKIFLRNI